MGRWREQNCSSGRMGRFLENFQWKWVNNDVPFGSWELTENCSTVSTIIGILSWNIFS